MNRRVCNFFSSIQKVQIVMPLVVASVDCVLRIVESQASVAEVVGIKIQYASLLKHLVITTMHAPQYSM